MLVITSCNSLHHHLLNFWIQHVDLLPDLGVRLQAARNQTSHIRRFWCCNSQIFEHFVLETYIINFPTEPNIKLNFFISIHVLLWY